MPSDQQETTPAPVYSAPTRRIYRDRLGRPITDPGTIEARYVQEQMRRLSTRNAGQSLDTACTVGDLAKATRLTPQRIVEIHEERGQYWYWFLAKGAGPIASWWIMQDGD